MIAAAEFLPLILATPLLCFAAWSDLRYLRIPNGLVAAVLICFVIALPWLTWDSILWRLVAASVAFVVCFAMFAARFLGGGDAKMFPAMLLVIPPQHLSLYFIIFAAALAASISILLGFRKLLPVARTDFSGLHAEGKVPMAMAFALSFVTLCGMWLIS